MNIKIKISKTEIKKNEIKINDLNIGAMISFFGIVKKNNNNKKVKNINYFIFENLFFYTLKKYCNSLIKKDKNIYIYIKQYMGIIKPGKINIMVIIKSKNRKKSFVICHKILEFIKNNSPIWKKEIYIDETSKWINA